MMKEYNTKIFLTNQDQYEKVDQRDLDQFDCDIDHSKAYISDLKQIQNQLNSDLKNLSEEISNEELERRLITNRQKLKDLENTLNKIESSKIEEIPDEKIKEAEKAYETAKINYKKVRKACLGILDYLGESLDLNRKDTMVSDNILIFRV